MTSASQSCERTGEVSDAVVQSAAKRDIETLRERRGNVVLPRGTAENTLGGCGRRGDGGFNGTEMVQECLTQDNCSVPDGTLSIFLGGLRAWAGPGSGPGMRSRARLSCGWILHAATM